MKMLLLETRSYTEFTLGRLTLGNFKCFTLELPWLDNKQSVSCIPEGAYDYQIRISPTLGKVIHILDVKDRTWIYIHAGNFTSQIKGCILVGDSIRYVNSDNIPDITNSRSTFNKLLDLVGESGQIKITR